MSSQINNKSFKIIISILSILLLISMFYIYKMSDHSRGVILSLRSEKANLEYDLNQTKLALDNAIAQKGHLNVELITERARISQLLNDLKSGTVNDADIDKIKLESKNLELRVAYLMHEIDNYKKKIDSTNTELIASKAELNVAKEAKDTLENRNQKLSRKLSENGEKLVKASKLKFYNLESTTFRRKNSGDIVFEEKANRVNIIKTNFIIGENELALVQNKVFYIQIIAPDETLIGNTETTSTGERIADYSAIAYVKFDGKSQKIEKQIPVANLKPGVYHVKLIDNETAILETTFDLK